jgi:precorrin-6B C5,15-methyltransferase / cobalt-precorrin-6B C5,C15-methyltransferase
LPGPASRRTTSDERRPDERTAMSRRRMSECSLSEGRIPRIVVIGVPPDGVVHPAEQTALASAETIAAGRRHLEAHAVLAAGKETIEITKDVSAALEAIGTARANGRRVVVLASGDPGYFGVGRALAERFGPASLDVRPAASSVATAFGRVGLPWDDAVVVSVHGRQLDAALLALHMAQKAAVLTSPDNPPERIGSELALGGWRFDRTVVVSDLGLTTEAVQEGPGLEWLAAGSFSALSVVLLINGSGVRSEPVMASPAARPETRLRFGRGEDDFEHRDGMITKSEVRSVVLSRLDLPASGVLWDVGAGSGSVGIEAAGLAPGLRVIAVERVAEDAARIRENADRHGVRVEVVEGQAPGAFASLPTPDRAFVGGGGLPVLDAVLARLNPAGRVVASYAALERAIGAGDRLGNLVQVSISRGTRLPDASFRLAALDPVFVCWGPS